ncbi:MAG: S-adenosylmethionine--diacylglycerol 3-amino-3-carboxypropyl transferase [Rhizobiales bacterium 65-9]|nr:DUF3419 family protein [Hyphomicrobiales bacterium]OJY37245.1 MAG: S-adenosylmethionine--diacylglycerol 3-amino-3-carboxypropyl transferase [Rhizobiales bacterium 65-9]
MSAALPAHPARSGRLVREAVRREGGGARGDLLEAAFAAVFSGLVYPQIWEDPVVDMEGLALRADHRIAAISSGGCNVMSYLIRAPERILAVDLNAHHIALLKLKIAAARHLPTQADFAALFARADQRDNIARFDVHLAPKLDEATRAYWNRRDMTGRRRISRFARGFHRYGALGRFIGFAHLLARAHGFRPERILAARDRDEQRAIFHREIAPALSTRLVRAMAASRGSLFGLGIPPAQHEALAGGRPMADVLRDRLERLACGFDIGENYFAWQAFGRRYAQGPDASLPPYLEAVHFDAVRRFAGRVEPVQQPLTETLAREPERSLDRYALLDAQDWMAPADLTALWTQITRTARDGARVIFRTAAEPTLLPGRVDPALLAQWRYEEALSRDLTRRDRSAIYGGAHVYALKRA